MDLMEKLSEILKIENDPAKIKEYFSDLNDDEFIKTYKKIKKKSDNIELATEYISIILDITGYTMEDELVQRFFSDTDLLSYIEIKAEENKKAKEAKEKIEFNAFTNILVKVYEEDQTDSKIAYVSPDGSITVYVYEISEEREAFKKYNASREKLKKYIEENDKYKDVIELSKKLTATANPKHYKNKEPEFNLIYIIENLYSETYNEEECLVRLRNDPVAHEIISECKEIRDEIAIHNYGLSKRLSGKGYYQNRGLAQADLFQAGNEGLMKAIERFDVTKKFKFSTYANWWIKQSMTRAIQYEGNTIRIPVHIHEKKSKISYAYKLLRDEDGIENPSVEEIYQKCKEIGMDMNYDLFKTVIKLSDPISYDQKVGEDEESSLIDFIPDYSSETTSYAEGTNMNDLREEYLKNIGKGLTRFGNKIKNSTKDTTKFKLLTFYTIEGDPINILLLDEEYKYYIEGAKKNGRERFLEFLTKYGIKLDTLSSKFTKSDYEVTAYEREVFIYRMRKGFHNAASRRFIKFRNRNNALYDQEAGYGTGDVVTLEKIGKLFGITRERIRQIETKVYRKMGEGPDAEKTASHTEICMGDKPINIYDLFGIVSQENWILTIPKNDIIESDDDHNITPHSVGTVVITLKNIKTTNIKELVIHVKPSPKDILKDLNVNKLTLKPTKKDSQ